MKMRLTAVCLVVAAVLLCCIAGFAASQDEITALVDKGRKALDDGKYQEALELFQQVVQKIQALVGESFERFMPRALSGWTAGEIESQSWTGTTAEASHSMTHLTREYTRETDEVRCTVNITNWPHLVEGLQQSMQAYKQMEQLLSGDPRIQVKIDEKGDWTVLQVVDSTEKTVELSAVHEKLMVAIEVNKEDVEVAEKYLDAIDLAGLAGAVK